MDEQGRRDKTGLRSSRNHPARPPQRAASTRPGTGLDIGRIRHGEIRLGKSGVFGILLGLLVLVVALVAAIAVLAGLLLFWIPIVGLIFAAFVLSGLARRRRPR